MKIARWLCLFFVTSVAAVSFAGDIQVSCSPGLRVYLDDEFMGTSSAKEDGLFLMNVPHGTRVIRVEKDGFVPQSIQIEGYCPGTWFTKKSRDMVYTSTMAGSWRESHAVDGDIPREGAYEICGGY